MIPQLECVELLLSSITHRVGEDGLRSSFFFGKPGAPHWERRMGTDLYYHPRELTLACLHLRKHGPAYLRALSIDTIWSMLTDFVIDNYWYLADETWAKPSDDSYATQVSSDTKMALAAALASSPIFSPTSNLTLFPLVPVTIADPFVSEPFFFLSPTSLATDGVPEEFSKWIVPNAFPPLAEWKGKRELAVTGWLGIRSPVVEAAEKAKAAILGALALTPLPQYRHFFSGRHSFGGRCTITPEFGTTTSFGEPHTPPLMHNVVLTAEDHPWLSLLAQKLSASDNATRRELRALEYFYRAWPTEASERFPILCMALDAVFGEANNSTQALIDGIRITLGSHVSDVRLRKLMSLRGSVIHGGAPDVYDSSKYAEYYSTYVVDPIHDIELTTAACLRTRIFGSAIRTQEDPNAEVLRHQQEKGVLPKQLRRPSILDEPKSPGE